MNPHHPDMIHGLQWTLLKKEYFRLITFGTYKDSACKNAILLARNGFVYVGTGSHGDDSVLCVFCLLTHRGWRPEDNISAIHQRLSPECCLITGADNTNVAFHSETSSATLSQFSEGDMTQTGIGPLSHSSGSDLDHTNDFGEVDGALVSTDEVDGYSALASINNGIGSINLTGASSEHPNMLNRDISISSDEDSADPVVGLPHSTSDETNQGEGIDRSNNRENSQSELTPSSSPQSTIPSPGQSSGIPTEASQSPTSQLDANDPGLASGGVQLDQLGVYTDLPKRPEMGRKDARRETFQNWDNNHPLRVSDLVAAGFYFSGYSDSDSVRCFYCDGGLHNWELGDSAIVEHARWYPRCVFLKQTVGLMFIKVVQDLDIEGREQILIQDVLEKLDDDISQDPTFLAFIDVGFDRKDVLDAAKQLRREQEWPLSVSLLGQKLEHKFPPKPEEHIRQAMHAAKTKETIHRLEEVNQDLRNQGTCKVCLANPLTIMFLPCGHLACCSDCAQCLLSCPICRRDVKGVVRVYLR